MPSMGMRGCDAGTSWAPAAGAAAGGETGSAVGWIGVGATAGGGGGTASAGGFAAMSGGCEAHEKV